MSDPFDSEKQDEPLDPAVERVQVKLRRLLMGSSLIMVLGLGSVVAAIVYKLNERSENDDTRYRVPAVVTEADMRRASYPLPKNARVVSTAFSGDNLAVTYEVPGEGGGVLLIDVPSWQVYSIMALPQK